MSDKAILKCCFTGHRPEKIRVSIEKIIIELEREITKAVSEGYTVFISGMAQGVDIWAAEIVLNLRKNNNSVKLVCALPYKGFENSWDEEWKSKYRNILSEANEAVFVCNHYSTSCFQIRNEWMVNRAERVVAVFNGEKGGTLNTIKYAKKHGVDVREIKATD